MESTDFEYVIEEGSVRGPPEALLFQDFRDIFAPDIHWNLLTHCQESILQDRPGLLKFFLPLFATAGSGRRGEFVHVHHHPLTLWSTSD